MSEGKHFIPIWFFIGVLLLIYGVLILGFGIYGLFIPPVREVEMGHLHAEIWWGAVLVALGAGYAWWFLPGRRKDGAG